MTVKEVYEACGGGYDEMFSKFHDDKIIATFLKMFLRDESFNYCAEKLAADDTKGAFEAVHNLKGMVLNLNLVSMMAPVYAVTEDLRRGDIAAAKEHFVWLEQAYVASKSAISNLQ